MQKVLFPCESILLQKLSLETLGSIELRCVNVIDERRQFFSNEVNRIE
jgi:hypothetical protein